MTARTITLEEIRQRFQADVDAGNEALVLLATQVMTGLPLSIDADAQAIRDFFAVIHRRRYGALALLALRLLDPAHEFEREDAKAAFQMLIRDYRDIGNIVRRVYRAYGMKAT